MLGYCLLEFFIFKLTNDFWGRNSVFINEIQLNSILIMTDEISNSKATLG